MITKAHNHNCFFVLENILFEEYKTIIGLRYRTICEVDYPQTDKVSEVDLLIIESQIMNKSEPQE